MNKEERMYELLKHRYDKKITTFNLFEDIEALLQENEQLKEYINEANKDLYWANNYDDILCVVQELEKGDSNGQ